jgi:hypothetical protein
MNCGIRPFALFCTLLACLVCGCSSKKNTPEDAKLKNNVYTNKFFGFQVRIPDTWTVVKKPSTRDAREGTELLLGHRRMAASAARAAKQNRYLLTARNVVQGKSIGVFAHSMINLPDVETGKDLLDELMELGAGPGKPMQQVGEITTVKLASREFYRADVTINVMGQRQHSAMLVTIEKGYALMVILTARSEDGVDEVLTNVGLGDRGASRKGLTVAAREPWHDDIKLQGISGTGTRRLAIINGKTFATGDTNTVKVRTKTVTIYCVDIGEKSATVTFDGAEAKRELRLGVY